MPLQMSTGIANYVTVQILMGHADSQDDNTVAFATHQRDVFSRFFHSIQAGNQTPANSCSVIYIQLRQMRSKLRTTLRSSSYRACVLTNNTE